MRGHSHSILAGLQILVVDDNKDLLDMLATMLKLHGAEVSTAASVHEALEAFARVTPDALVSDIGMPEEGGYSLIRRVRALEPERGGNVPALAFTGFSREYTRAQSLAAGFQEHLSKAIEPEDLVAAIARLVGR